MKKLIYTLFTIVFFVIGACTDLDVVPKNRLTEDVAFLEEGSYTAYLAKLYASFMLTGQEGPAGNADITIISDEGFSSYMRAYWKAQELTTDEAVIRWTDAGIQDMNTHTWSSDNQFVRVLYYRIFFTTALCNDFLRISEPSLLDERNISPDFQNEIAIYRLEARFLRALAYWHALDLYRNVALVTTITAELPSQVPPQQIYDFIISELEACVQGLPSASEAEYGRVNSEAARMLRAKVRLNAPNYLTNPPQSIYNDVVNDVSAVINSGNFSLNPVYLYNFNADNHSSPEVIWALSQDGVASQGWGGTTFMVRAVLFENSMTATDWGVVSGWSGIRTTPEFNSLFEISDGVLDSLDSRNVLWTVDDNDQGITPRPESTQADILGEGLGYLAPKFSNISSDSAAGANSDFVDTDFPYFRLADAYLIYAEAVLRGATNGDVGTALGYINELRERAYGNSNNNITGADLTLDFILNERGRELYYEGTRRIDLIRFNKFSSRAGAEELIWEWKGAEAAGKSIPPFLEIFPIPASDLGVNGNFRQNNGY
ncbi:MAG: RagB/SusD family nutrient uptake outer membrane protein [Cytophagales bacterium]